MKNKELNSLKEYKYGFTTQIEDFKAPKGLTEETVRFISKIKEKKVSFCKVKIGGFYEKTKCLENIPVNIELDNKNKSLDIFPESPIPSDKNDYAIVLKVTNPNRGGLYQFHSFGQSSGNVPVSFYLGSWTLKTQSI